MVLALCIYFSTILLSKCIPFICLHHPFRYTPHQSAPLTASPQGEAQL